ncbi:MAG: bifunctional phosphopantothenoylcysteine decarboxylase/phosphopantothenate--cysteine ligase CoaBC, partial [Gemmatimonadota bacterium]|nr:bifunctional phosphopantothenoylcysteine decarboxylase/phosphopantothenate--cysteine ligase CoaBC [Gemmatimonadota bacterium]
GSGPGRMPEPETIMAYVGRMLEPNGALRGRRIVVTAGPTREPVDPVRFLSNRSTGKMGVAIATAAWRRGADVTLVAGPLEVAVPRGVNVTPVETTTEMADAVRAALGEADALVMAAAPADFGAAKPATKKIKKRDRPEAIALASTPDILRVTRDARRPGAVIVGFALETGDAVDGGREKLAAKDLDLVVVNDAEDAKAGFAVDTNRVTILHRDGRTEALGVMLKSELADSILDRVEALLRER